MPGSFRIGRIIGIPISINYTWVFIFALLTWALANNIYPTEWSWGARIGTAVATSLLFFASVVAHELSHSVVAIRHGIPVRSITLFIFGGVAQITKEADRPRTEVLIALAGPLMSLALGGALWGISQGIADHNSPWYRLTWWLGVINVQLAVFNMIPGFPLDGGRVFRGIVWAVTGNFKRATLIASMTGRGVAWLFIIGGVAGFVVARDGSLLWLSFIGWFLENAASTAYTQAVVHEGLKGYRARDIMTSSFAQVPPQTNILDLVDHYLLQGGWRWRYFLVMVNDALQGLLTVNDIRRVPRQRWISTSVGQIMTPREKLRTVSPNDDALSVLGQMDQYRMNQVPVLEEGRVVGVVGREQVAQFLRTRAELRV
ncbi:MAG: site-2 protease family protein [Chloroflexi bacterium]|nr:site-2 protease family protein [Chloroflexota bacterium]